jgi:hypothetical protein
MALAHSPSIVTNGLAFYYDMGNDRKSWKGVPTTNLNRNSKDVSGSAYASDDEWVSSEPTRFTKTYNPSITTPVGTGATLLQESGTNGYHHLSRWGGAEATGDHALSCYVYPIATNIDNFSIGLLAAGNITYNLTNRTISYSSGEVVSGSGFIQDVPGYPGWLRIGGVINGRAGGWVGCIGLSVGSAYTGTSGSRSFYITGLQYERKTFPTAFVESQQTRSNTQAILDLTNNNTITANSLTYATDGTFSFNGSSNNLSIGSFGGYPTNITCEAFFKTTSAATWKNIVCGPNGDLIFTINGNLVNFGCQGNTPIPHANFSTTIVNTGNWFHAVATYDGSTVKIYVNGVLESTTARSGTITAGAKNIGSSSGGGSEYFNGTINNVKIYNRALTAAEIQQNFTALRGRYGI